MADIVRLRARRFDALYQLLTGAAHRELPAPVDGSDHLRRDIGLPEQRGPGVTAPPFGALPVTPLHR